MVICPWTTCKHSVDGKCQSYNAIELEQIDVAYHFEHLLSTAQLAEFDKDENNYLLKCKNYTLGGK